MRRPLTRLLVLGCCALLVLGPALLARAAPNPFTSPPAASPAEAADHVLTSPLAPALRVVAGWQDTLRRSMSRAAQAIHEEPFGKAFWIFLALALAYGAAHALGPGHGKILAVSYFLHRDASARQALGFAYLSMLLHVLSATTLVLGGRFLLEISASRAVDDMGELLQRISYGLLAVVGVGMLAAAARQCRKGRKEKQRPAGNGEAPQKADKSLYGLILATGMVPCPGAALVLIFSISLRITGAGLAAMVAISLGMGLCLAAFSLLAVKCRRGLFTLMACRAKLLQTARCLFSLIGGLVVTGAGLLLLLGSLWDIAHA